MNSFKVSKASTTRLQWLLWISVYLITFFSMLPMDGFYQSLAFSFISLGFYALIIYGNISFLYPRYYENDLKISYIASITLLLIFCGVGKGLLISYIYNAYFAARSEHTNLLYTLIYYMLGGILVYVLSFIFRIAIAYFSLKSQTEEILLQKTQAELNLLKSQVQPHFLFNTLNNIYYESYLEAPRTADLIERLADIMRYFVDESPKEAVPVATEIHFLENYMALEKIRIRHDVKISFIKDFPDDILIPPMLLMTLVENIFKHGIDKSMPNDNIEITLQRQGDQLVFHTRNGITSQLAGNPGFGLQNLRKRLNILYGENFELSVLRSELSFTSYLKIPIS